MSICQVGDKIILEKNRPCGRNLWEILRTGVDIKLKCTGCQHTIWLSRLGFEKRVRKIQEGDGLVSTARHKKED